LGSDAFSSSPSTDTNSARSPSGQIPKQELMKLISYYTYEVFVNSEYYLHLQPCTCRSCNTSTVSGCISGKVRCFTEPNNFTTKSIMKNNKEKKNNWRFLNFKTTLQPKKNVPPCWPKSAVILTLMKSWFANRIRMQFRRPPTNSCSASVAPQKPRSRLEIWLILDHEIKKILEI
jgi:hypothetical protein